MGEGENMTNSRLMTITVANEKLEKNGDITYITKKLPIPECVVADYIPYFSHAVQVNAYNMTLINVQSIMYKLECTNTSNYTDEQMDAYNKKCDYWNAYKKAFKAYIDKYLATLSSDLMDTIKSDTFARTYTAVQLKHYSYAVIDEKDDGTKVAVNKLTKEIFPSVLKDGNTTKTAVTKIATVIGDVNASKKDREESMKPLRDKLAELFPNNGTYKEIYKNPSFNKMSKRYFDAFLFSTRKDAKQDMAYKDPIVLTQNLAYIGLAWLKVIDIKEFEPEETLISPTLVRLPKPEAVNN